MIIAYDEYGNVLEDYEQKIREDVIDEYTKWLKTQIVGLDSKTKEILVIIDDKWKLANEIFMQEIKTQIPRDTPIDTKILVSDDMEHWHKRYFAGFCDDYINAWQDGCTSWSIIDVDDVIGWKYAKLAVEDI